MLWVRWQWDIQRREKGGLMHSATNRDPHVGIVKVGLSLCMYVHIWISYISARDVQRFQ